MKQEVMQHQTKKTPSIRIVPVGEFLIRNLNRIHLKYPDIVQVKMGIAGFYLVSDPALIQEILVTKHRDFIKGKFLQRTKKVFGEGLLTSEGDFHHKQRSLVQPAFQQTRIESYSTIVEEYADRAMGLWKNGQILDIHLEMMKLTMSIVAKCLFDSDLESESKSLVKDLTTTIEYFNRLSSPLAGLLKRLPTNRKYEKAVGRIDSMIYDLIKRRRESQSDEGDLLSMLLRARDEGHNEMSDRQLRDEILILFAAGHETTANALTWTWYLLSQNPSVGDKLHAEVDQYSRQELKNSKTLQKLEYTTKVFTESMRLYPPAWVLVRQALENCQVGNYSIPAGADIVISQYLSHRDPRFFPRPENFEPERWTTQMKKSLPKFAYYPFGGGPRSCVGEPFAWMEGVLLLALISKNWNMIHLLDHKVEMLPRITLRPKFGMKMRLEKRVAT